MFVKKDAGYHPVFMIIPYMTVLDSQFCIYVICHLYYSLYVFFLVSIFGLFIPEDVYKFSQ